LRSSRIEAYNLLGFRPAKRVDALILESQIAGVYGKYSLSAGESRNGMIDFESPQFVKVSYFARVVRYSTKNCLKMAQEMLTLCWQAGGEHGVAVHAQALVLLLK
jgi:hypothetical protein